VLFFGINATDPKLMSHPKQIAKQVGAWRGEIRVDDSEWGKTHPGIHCSPFGNLLVHRRLLEDFSPAQLDFILAKTIAWAKIRIEPRGRLFFLAAMASMLGLWGVGTIALALSSPLLWYSLGTALLLFLPLTYLAIRLSHELEQAADRVGLEIARDLTAAETAIQSLYKDSDQRRLNKRPDALRKAAQEMGITPSV
jgi:hypothetical protein